MRRLGQVLMIAGACLGVSVGAAMLLDVTIPGLSWLMAVAAAKLTLVTSGALIASGAVAQRVANRQAARLAAGSDTNGKTAS